MQQQLSHKTDKVTLKFTAQQSSFVTQSNFPQPLHMGPGWKEKWLRWKKN